MRLFALVTAVGLLAAASASSQEAAVLNLKRVPPATPEAQARQAAINAVLGLPPETNTRILCALSGRTTDAPPDCGYSAPSVPRTPIPPETMARLRESGLLPASPPPPPPPMAPQGKIVDVSPLTNSVFRDK